MSEQGRQVNKIEAIAVGATVERDLAGENHAVPVSVDVLHVNFPIVVDSFTTKDLYIDKLPACEVGSTIIKRDFDCLI